MNKLLLFFMVFAFAKANYTQAQDFYQKVDWEHAPYNPVGFYNHKSHYKLKGDVIMKNTLFFDTNGLLLVHDLNRFIYDKSGRIVACQNGDKVVYNEQHLVAKVLNSKGIVSRSFEYDKNKNLIKSINGGKTVLYTYVANRLVEERKISSYDNTVRTYTYKDTKDGLEIKIYNDALKTTNVNLFKNGRAIKYVDKDGNWQLVANKLDKKGNVLDVSGAQNKITNQLIYYSDTPVKIATIDFLYKDWLDKTLYVNNELYKNYLLLSDENSFIIYLPHHQSYYRISSKEPNRNIAATLIQKDNPYLFVKNGNGGYIILDHGVHVKDIPNNYAAIGDSYVFYYDFGDSFKNYVVDKQRIETAKGKTFLPVRVLDSNASFYAKNNSGQVDVIDKGVLMKKESYLLSSESSDIWILIPKIKSLPTYYLQEINKARIGELVPADSSHELNDFTRRLEQELPKGYDVEKIMNGAIKGKEITEINQPNYSYYGQMANNTYDGFGRYIWKDSGNFTIGYWEKNLREGLHIKRASNGSILEAGMYVKDKLLSNQKWTNNTEKTPGCIGDCINGFGELRTTDKHLYIGFFKNGKLDGIAIMVNENGSQYEGEVKNGLRHGYGDWYAKNGQVYHGNFENDRTNGYGILIEKDGAVKKGIFKDDKLVTAM